MFTLSEIIENLDRQGFGRELYVGNGMIIAPSGDWDVVYQCSELIVTDFFVADFSENKADRSKEWFVYAMSSAASEKPVGVLVCPSSHQDNQIARRVIRRIRKGAA